VKSIALLERRRFPGRDLKKEQCNRDEGGGDDGKGNNRGPSCGHRRDAISTIGDMVSHIQSGSDVTCRAVVSPSKTCSVVLTYARVATGSHCKCFA